jgi:hypothetical protein
VKQRLRRFDEEKRKVIGEEIHKLLEAEFIKEVHHPEWLANPVSQIRKARICLKIYTRGLAVITRHLEPLLETHSDKVSIGQPQSPTLSS